MQNPSAGGKSPGGSAAASELSVWKSFNPLSQWLLPIRRGLISHIRGCITGEEKAEVLMTQIRSIMFVFAGEFHRFGSLFLFFSATIEQVASPAQASGVVQVVLIFLAKETRATTF